MSHSAAFLNPSDAARRLGVSAKALRLYEAHGLVSPVRTGAGWRAYGPQQMARAAEIVALRTLGLGLGQIGDVLGGGAQVLEPALAAHQAALESQARQVLAAIDMVRRLRARLAQDQTPAAEPPPDPPVAFELPWPWGGERFELSEVRPINYIIGPLGCGKLRLALRLAEVLPGAAFLPMERASDGGAAAHRALEADPGLRSRVDEVLAALVADGAAMSDSLITLLVGLEAEGPVNLVVDMIEEGLDEPTQSAVMAHLRRRASGARPLFLITRSSAILDLAASGADEAIIFCPANHSPPIRVDPYPGAVGYEAVATCLASPQVRARTQGMRAWSPQAA